MRTEDLSVALRRRSPWEALDLGAAMVRQWWRPLYGAWLIPFVPVALVVMLVFGPTWGTFVLWLFKPLFDRVALHVLATAVFATPPTPRQTFQALRKRIGPGWFASLTWRRFDPARSFNLPIAQLEGQSGVAGRERRRILHRFAHSYAVWLTVAFVHFEFVLFFAGLAISDLLIPASSSESYDFFSSLFEGRFDQSEAVTWFSAIIYVVTVAVLEPIYVACGFALYLNRRTLLEGWDIEVQFRRLAESINAAASRAAAVALIALGCALGALLCDLGPVRAADESVTPADANAEQSVDSEATVEEDAPVEPPMPPAAPTARAASPDQPGLKPSATNEEIQARATEILKGPEFGKMETKKRLTYIGPEWNLKKKPEETNTSDPWNFGLLPSELFRVLVYLFLALVLGYIAVIIYRNLRANGGNSATPYRPPDTMFGLDVRPESLPDDIRTTALQLVRTGDLRGALALLYRASLVILIQKDHVELQSSDTENECVDRAADKISAPRLTFFKTLLWTWETVAYARAPVTQEDVIALCESWPNAFEIAT